MTEEQVLGRVREWAGDDVTAHALSDVLSALAFDPGLLEAVAALCAERRRELGAETAAMLATPADEGIAACALDAARDLGFGGAAAVGYVTCALISEGMAKAEARALARRAVEASL